MSNQTPEKPGQSQDTEAQKNFAEQAENIRQKGKERIDRFVVSETEVDKGEKAKERAKNAFDKRFEKMKTKLETDSAKQVTRRNLVELKGELEREAKAYLDAIEAIMVRVAKRELETNDEKEVAGGRKQGEVVMNSKERQEFFALLAGLDKLQYGGVPKEYTDLLLRVARAKNQSEQDLRKVGELTQILLEKEASNLRQDQIKQTALGLTFGLLEPGEKMKAAKYAIDNLNPGMSDNFGKWLMAMGSSGAMDVAQIKELADYANKKGFKVGTIDDAKMAETAKAFKKHSKEIWDHINANGDDKNPALSMITLGNTLGVVGIAWGLITVIMNVAVTLKDKNYGDALNFYTGLGAAAIAGGFNKLTGKLPFQDTLSEPSQDEKERDAVAKAEAEIKGIFGSDEKVGNYLSKNNGFFVAMKAMGQKMALIPEEKRGKTDVKIDYADLSKTDDALRGSNAPENPALKALNNPFSMEGINKIVKYAMLMKWPYDAGKPEITQNRFDGLYKKYAKEKGLEKRVA